jgi:peptide/nickel transport system permease protein
MVVFILKRVAFAIVTLLVATWIAFMLVHLSGSTPGAVALGQLAKPEQIVAYN